MFDKWSYPMIEIFPLSYVMNRTSSSTSLGEGGREFLVLPPFEPGDRRERQQTDAIAAPEAGDALVASRAGSGGGSRASL